MPNSIEGRFAQGNLFQARDLSTGRLQQGPGSDFSKQFAALVEEAKKNPVTDSKGSSHSSAFLNVEKSEFTESTFTIVASSGNPPNVTSNSFSSTFEETTTIVNGVVTTETQTT